MGEGPRMRLVPRVRRWEVVADLCRQCDARLAVELGVFRGQTFGWLLEHCPDLTVIGVDTWAPGDPERDPPSEAKKTAEDDGYRSYAGEDLEAAYQAVQSIAGHHHHRRAVVWRRDTVSAADWVDPASIDLVFHDADHPEAGPEAETHAWASRVRPGGIICGHDYDMPSVRAVIDRLVPGWRAMADSVWFIPKAEVGL